MLDIKLLRENPKVIKENLKKRNVDVSLDKLIKLDTEWRSLKYKMQELQHKRNQMAIDIAKKKTKDKLTQMKKISAELNTKETKEKEMRKKIYETMLLLPNILHKDVPKGKDESENVEIRKVGKPPKFNFKAKDHLTLALDLDLIDQERGAKAAGSGFYYLKGPLVLLDLALTRFALDFMMKKGFTAIEPPFMLKRRPYSGMVSLNDFEDVMYKIQDDDLYLIATSEHPIGAMYMDETLKADELPLKFTGVSTNFRREVGTHGKYVRGMYRMHQFNKVEQFVFSHPDESWKIFEELQKNSEELFKKLELAFRVVNLCTGDIGFPAAKTYDIETWMADGKYREGGSCSNCTDFQARRLNIKFDDKGTRNFVHTLNNTAVATSRTMLAILEQNQQSDGSIVIPKVLRPYMNGIKKIEKQKK